MSVGENPVLVDGGRDDVVDIDDVGVQQRVFRLQPRELDDLLGEARQSRRFLRSPTAHREAETAKAHRG